MMETWDKGVRNVAVKRGWPARLWRDRVQLSVRFGGIGLIAESITCLFSNAVAENNFAASTRFL